MKLESNSIKEYAGLRNDRRYRVDTIVSWITRRIRKSLMQVQYTKMFGDSFLNKGRATIGFNRDYGTALRVIRNENSLDKEDRFNMAIAASEDIAREAREIGDLKLALAAEKNLADLEGLYTEDKHGNIEVIFNTAMPVAGDVDGPVEIEVLEDYKKLAGIDD